MTHRHTLLAVSVAVALLVSPTIMAQETGTATRNATDESGATAGMGAQVTAFTQSTSTAVNESVENGMWQAGFEQSNASDRARLVRDRAGTLERRLERLRQQNATLRDRYENGSLPEPAYVARQSRLGARIDALRTAINDTDEAATRAGVNDSRLERLGRNASELSGPEVAAIARGLGGGPPADRGPPEDRGPPDERGQSANRTGEAGPPDGERGDTGERGQSANRTDEAGPPDGERGQPARGGAGPGDQRNSTSGAGEATGDDGPNGADETTDGNADDGDTARDDDPGQGPAGPPGRAGN